MTNPSKAAGPYSGDEPKKPAKPKKKTEALGLDDGMQPSAPKLIIVSDGTPGGSSVFVHGQEIDPKRMDFYCTKPDPNSEYEFEREGECSFSMSVEKSDGDFTKTVTVRMRGKAEQEFSDEFVQHLPAEAAAIVRKALDKQRKN